jgi:DNA-binding response OmpR family regulator
VTAIDFSGISLLIVEDEINLAELLATHFTQLGCTVQVAHDGITGAALAREHSFDLLLLDVSLPGKGGVTICREVRERDPMTPIMMLTSHSSEIDIVTSLAGGADDYLTKPFGLAELVARIQALLRRSTLAKVASAAHSETGEAAVIIIGELEIDPRRRRVLLEAQEVQLTSMEFDLLYFLASNPGTVFTRDQLLRAVWQDENGLYSFSVNAIISRLRRKIEGSSKQPRYLLTARGVGYRFVEPGELA